MYCIPQLLEAVAPMDRAHTLDGRYYAEKKGDGLLFYENVLTLEENKPVTLLPIDIVSAPVWVVSHPF